MSLPKSDCFQLQKVLKKAFHLFEADQICFLTCHKLEMTNHNKRDDYTRYSLK